MDSGRQDTIAAIATAPGRGGVAVIRVSGVDAFSLAERLTGHPPVPGRIACRDIAGVDRGVVLAFRAPHSYTGEDVVEFQCHGGSVTPRRVLAACFRAGARLARRGEFTERAFLNGRLGLSEAEAVIDLVDARTDRAADDALARLAGADDARRRELYAAALDLSTRLEHALDIDEGELPADFISRCRADSDSLVSRIDSVLGQAARGRLLRRGALVVLAGPPNAGKSSLLNALLGENRAIVSDIPGTTRDSIEEGLDLDGWPVRLTDTAGLRGTADCIEGEGVRRAEELMARADIVLLLSDGDEYLPCPTCATVLKVRTKADLCVPTGTASSDAIVTSAKTAEGLPALRAAIVRELERQAGARTDGESTPTERECSLLTEARAALLGAREENDPVLLANGARAAAETLGRLVGAVYSEDLLTAVFSRFCVGK